MCVQIQCAFCGKSFDPTVSGSAPSVNCPHCGKSNSLAAPTVPARSKPCAPCGCHANNNWMLMVGAALLALVAFTAFLFWPKPENPIPEAPVATPAEAKPTPPAPTRDETSAHPVPPPSPISIEIPVQKGEAERVAQEAEQALRQQLDEREPLYKINETVELQRTNGFIDKGTLTSFSGTGTGRVALVATPTREIGVPLEVLDSSSRRRLDPDFREAYIAQMLRIQQGSVPE